MAQMTALEITERTEALESVGGSFVDRVGEQLQALVSEGLQLPPDYAVSTALKAAGLMLQTVTVKIDGKYQPALEACSRRSVANALLDMAVQALDPSRKQCYFIAYNTKGKGPEVCCQRSYYGDEMLAVRVLVAAGYQDVKIRAEVVYKKDTFRYRLEDGQKVITLHEQELGNISTSVEDVVAGYCVVTCDGQQHRTVVRTLAQIRTAWNHSKTWQPGKGGTFHEDTPDHAVRRTVIRRACTEVFNSSKDSHLTRAILRQSQVATVGEMAEERSQLANVTPIALPSQQVEVIEAATEETHGDLLLACAADLQVPIEVIIKEVTGEDIPVGELGEKDFDAVHQELLDEQARQLKSAAKS